MKKLAVVFAICALIAGAIVNNAEARQFTHIHNINHRYGGGFQFGFGNRGFYLGYGPGYGYRNYGYRGYGVYGGGLNYDYGLGYAYPYYEPLVPYTYQYNHMPRGYRYYSAPRYYFPYRGGRHWRY